MRPHFGRRVKTKDLCTSFITIHDTTVKIRQADGRNILIEQDTKKLFPWTRVFLMNRAPLQEQVQFPAVVIEKTR